jgi:L-ascorbate metabolism protein UlaG (beta-lactamase superfamily)
VRALADGQVALWWLGQSSFGLRARQATVLVDPFLSAHPDRLVAPPFEPSAVGGVDVVAVTHDHLDHLDEESLPVLAEVSPAARFVAPEPIAGRLTELGIPAQRIVGAQPGEAIQLGGVTIHPVPACHGDDPADAYGFGRERSDGLYRYLGYVLEFDGVRVYHAGDTIPYEGMEGLLTEIGVDVALLPINGRDPEREAQGIVGNLDEEEAARLAAAIGADLVVPMHYDMFAANLGSPERFVELVRAAYPELAVLVPTCTRVFVYTAPEARS